jgi:hypothetical protein
MLFAMTRHHLFLYRRTWNVFVRTTQQSQQFWQSNAFVKHSSYNVKKHTNIAYWDCPWTAILETTEQRPTTWHPLSSKLLLTSPTSGGRLVGIVRSRIEATELENTGDGADTYSVGSVRQNIGRRETSIHPVILWNENIDLITQL